MGTTSSTTVSKVRAKLGILVLIFHTFSRLFFQLEVNYNSTYYNILYNRVFLNVLTIVVSDRD